MEPEAMVTDQLQLVRPLESGSMGSVWVAFNHALQTEVAIKFMDPGLATDETFVARFIREARAAAQMKSNHVVKIQQIGRSTDGVPFIAMELLDGESLKKRLQREGKLSPADTKVVVKHVSKALKEAHRSGIVHRDIKPANIFLSDVDDELFVKLIDFGVAKKQADGLAMTQTYDRVGTPFYMAPEQLISAKHVDHRSDLWSVGVVAYHCLTGRVPFLADSFADLCINVAAGEYPPARELVPELPQTVDVWFQQLLVRAPDDRFATAREMADAFLAAV